MKGNEILRERERKLIGITFPNCLQHTSFLDFKIGKTPSIPEIGMIPIEFIQPE